MTARERKLLKWMLNCTKECLGLTTGGPMESDFRAALKEAQQLVKKFTTKKKS